MRQPEKYLSTYFEECPVKKELPNGRWVPARPMGHNAWGFLWRWKVSLDVLFGKADALYWVGE